LQKNKLHSIKIRKDMENKEKTQAAESTKSWTNSINKSHIFTIAAINVKRLNGFTN